MKTGVRRRREVSLSLSPSSSPLLSSVSANKWIGNNTSQQRQEVIRYNNRGDEGRKVG